MRSFKQRYKRFKYGFILENRQNFNTFLLISLLFWMGVFYGSLDYVYDPNTDFIWSLFNKRILGRGFYGIETVFLLLLLYILSVFSKQYVKKKLFLLLFWSLVLVGVITLLNPNNTNNVFELFLAQDAKFIWMLPLGFFLICFINKNSYQLFFPYFFRVGVFVLLLRASTLFFLYVIGKTGTFLGLKTSMPWADILLFTGVFQSFFLARFVHYGKRTDLYIAIFLFGMMLLSLRRTFTLLTLLINISYVVIVLSKMRKYSMVKRFASMVLFILILLFLLNSINIINIDFFIQRQASVFSFYDERYAMEGIEDSGHLEQAMETTQSMFSDLIFWGGGIQRDAIYLEGQSVAIHNSFAATMAKYGLHLTIHLVFQFILFGMLFWKHFWKKVGKRTSEYYSIKLLVLLWNLGFLLVGWASGPGIFGLVPHYYIFWILTLSLLNFSENSGRKLFLFDNEIAYHHSHT